MSNLHMGVVFVVFFSAYLAVGGSRAVRHDLAEGNVGRARYALLVRGHAIAAIALAPATTFLHDSPILPAILMFWFAWLPSILDPHWRRVDAPPVTTDARIVSARAAHPAGGRSPARPQPVSAQSSTPVP